MSGKSAKNDPLSPMKYQTNLPKRKMSMDGYVSMVMSRLKFKSFLMMVCLNIGCFWQMVSICSLYFNYPTNIFIDTKFDVFEQTVPALTFCTSVGQTHRGKNTSTHLFDNFSLNTTIEQISINSLADQVDIITDQYLSSVIESVSINYYCFTLNSQVKGVHKIDLYQNSVLHVKLAKFGAKASWWLYMHNSHDRSCTRRNSIELKKGYYYWITFALQSYQLLKKPYPTDCIDYHKETQFMSRKDCIRRCQLEISLRDCGVVPHEVDIYREESVVRFATDVEYDSCVFKLALNRVCPNKCPHFDCFKQDYKPVFISNNKHNESATEFRLVIPSDTQTIYHHKPKIETIEFVCFLASILNLWFGFSILSTLGWFSSLFNTIADIKRSLKGQSKRRHTKPFHFYLHQY